MLRRGESGGNVESLSSEIHCLCFLTFQQATAIKFRDIHLEKTPIGHSIEVSGRSHINIIIVRKLSFFWEELV